MKSLTLFAEKSFGKFLVLSTFHPLTVLESRNDLFSFTCGCKSISQEAAAINCKFIEARLRRYIT